ncbi:DUF4199 domain-containing protein [Ilyomonas limi]|nr:DUF4199 domain-containing protein [Ilyomonas limi]
MEKKEIKPATAGLIIGLVSIVLFLLYYFTGLIYHRDFTSFIPMAVSIVIIIVFINLWAKAKNNVVTYGSCFGYGFKSVCVAALIVFFFMVIFIYAFPDYKVHMLDVIKDQMNKNPKITDDQRDKGLAMVSKMFVISTLGGSLFGNLFIGTIASLIGAAIPKKIQADPFSQINQIGEPQ